MVPCANSEVIEMRALLLKSSNPRLQTNRNGNYQLSTDIDSTNNQQTINYHTILPVNYRLMKGEVPRYRELVYPLIRAPIIGIC